MAEKKKDKMEIKTRLLEVKKLNYFEKPLDEFPLSKDIDYKKIPFTMGFQLDIKDDKEELDFVLKIHFYQMNKDEKFDLFGITSSHKFKVFKFKEVFKKDEKNRYLIDNVVLASLLGISISGTRGMLAILNTNDDYKKIILPIVNPTDLIKNMSKKK